MSILFNLSFKTPQLREDHLDVQVTGENLSEIPAHRMRYIIAKVQGT